MEVAEPLLVGKEPEAAVVQPEAAAVVQAASEVGLVAGAGHVFQGVTFGVQE